MVTAPLVTILLAQPLNHVPPAGPVECPASTAQRVYAVAAWPSLQASGTNARALRSAVIDRLPPYWRMPESPSGMPYEGLFYYQINTSRDRFTWNVNGATGYVDADNQWQELYGTLAAQCVQHCIRPVNAIVLLHAPLADSFGQYTGPSVQPNPLIIGPDHNTCSTYLMRTDYVANAFACMTSYGNNTWSMCRDPGVGYPFGSFLYFADRGIGTTWLGADSGYIVSCEQDYDPDSGFDYACDCLPESDRPPDCCPQYSDRTCGTTMGDCHWGIQRCVDRRWTACEGSIGPSPEQCDFRDNDCNGVVDNLTVTLPEGGSITVGDNCTLPQDNCVRVGHWICDGRGGVMCDALHVQISEEVCDGEDNDCDGNTDVVDADEDRHFATCNS